MTLSTGTRLGPYEIVALLGEGGMGEVYRARDTKLNRDVAVKVLLPAVANDPDRLARFAREAQLLASLNHPHIAHIHGLEESSGVRALVMEIVEGPTLADRIAQGPIPIAEALPIAKQIADALEAAHEQGIIHRDLKPANIKVREDGTVKVLDFGLAKALEPAAASANAMSSPTLSVHATQAGLILGTAAYMSPEQARGKTVDKRADIWAFGCVLYEMLTGRRAFEGEDVTDTIAAVVRGEPDWNALPADTPEQIRLLLKRCLEKDRRARVSDIGVARFLMTETIASPASAVALTPSPPVPYRRRIVTGVSIGVLAGIIATAIAVWVMNRLTSQSPPHPVRFAIVPPSSQPLLIQGIDRDIAISPDGTHIVYRSGLTNIPSQSQLAVRALNELEPRLLPGTAGRFPSVSHDGRWIGFFTGGDLMKISMTGGSPVRICPISGIGRGASWGADDVIVFAMGGAGNGLWSVPATGGEPKRLTVPDGSKGELAHILPFVLPGARGVLFTIASGQSENAQVAVLDLETHQYKTLIRGGSDGVYTDTGHLVYAAAGALRAVRFDFARLEVLSDPLPVADPVMTGPTGAANFVLSRQGTLVYIPGGAATPFPARSLVWVNRQGREEAIPAPPGPYAVARLSPDGTRVALDVRDQGSDIWIYDVGRRTLTPVNLSPGPDMSPVWTHDGRHVIWTSSRGGGNPNLYWQSADGTGAAVRLTTSFNAQFPTSISSDDAHVAIYSGGGTGGAPGAMAISVVELNGASTPEQRRVNPLIQTGAVNFNPEISPDGNWIAYQSNESGRFQIYVRPFPNVEGLRQQISPSGGTRPAWSRHGRELFYLDGDDMLTSVSVQTTPTTFNAGSPKKILNTRYYAGFTTRGNDLRAYDVSADGQRFLMIKEAAPSGQTSTAASASMVVVLNWFEELKARVPAR